MFEAEDRLCCLRQGGRLLERYVGEFLELSNRVSWHDAALGACFQLGLDETTIRCDLPVSDFPLIELINLVLYLNGSDWEVEECKSHNHPASPENCRASPIHPMPGPSTYLASGYGHPHSLVFPRARKWASNSADLGGESTGPVINICLVSAEIRPPSPGPSSQIRPYPQPRKTIRGSSKPAAVRGPRKPAAIRGSFTPAVRGPRKPAAVRGSSSHAAVCGQSRPACSEYGKPACSEYGKPACSEYGKPACGSCGKPAGRGSFQASDSALQSPLLNSALQSPFLDSALQSPFLDSTLQSGPKSPHFQSGPKSPRFQSGPKSLRLQSTPLLSPRKFWGGGVVGLQPEKPGRGLGLGFHHGLPSPRIRHGRLSSLTRHGRPSSPLRHGSRNGRHPGGRLSPGPWRPPERPPPPHWMLYGAGTRLPEGGRIVRDPSQFLSPPSSVTSSDMHQIPVTIIAIHPSSDSPHLSSAINSPHKSQLLPVPSRPVYRSLPRTNKTQCALTCVYLPFSSPSILLRHPI